MGPALRKLLEIGGVPFLKDIDPTIAAMDRFGEIGASIENILRQKNGFFCFESALRIFPSVTLDLSWGITDWNRHDL